MKYVLFIFIMLISEKMELNATDILSNELSIKEYMNRVKFNLYTKYNPDEADVVMIYNESTFICSNFQRNKKIKVYIHGWMGNPFTSESLTIKNAFIEISNVNVFIVDWGDLAMGPASAVVRISYDVSIVIAKFIDWISTYGIKHSDIHIIGASLGGTVGGFVGRHCRLGTISYITACDPPTVDYSPELNVNSHDAAYVEIIYSSLEGPLFNGHSVFFPNGGVFMPGCSTNFCSHLRAYYYFVDSLDHKGFMADYCETIHDVFNKNCSKSHQIHMGGSLPKLARGYYYLETHAEKPYYKGKRK